MKLPFAIYTYKILSGSHNKPAVIFDKDKIILDQGKGLIVPIKDIANIRLGYPGRSLFKRLVITVKDADAYIRILTESKIWFPKFLIGKYFVPQIFGPAVIYSKIDSKEFSNFLNEYTTTKGIDFRN